MSNTIKCALIGCGRIAHNHIKAILAIPGLQLVALADIDTNRAESFKQEHSLPSEVACFQQLETLLQQISVDLLIICTPSGLHAQGAILGAKYGCHVLVEKPMATCLQDARAMIHAFDGRINKLFVVKQNRYNSTIQLLKQAIDSGRMGKVYQIVCNVLWTRPQEYYDAAKWRGTWEFDGGAFMNQASHSLDLLLWLFGAVESVQAFTATQARNIEAEDSGVVALKWRSGALGSINVSMLVYPKNLEGSLTIIAEKATVKLAGVAFNQIEKWEFADNDSSNIKLQDEQVKNNNYMTDSIYGFGHKIYYQKLFTALSGNPSAVNGAVHGTVHDAVNGANRGADLVDGRSGIKSLELITAIYRSARDKCCINLPLDF